MRAPPLAPNTVVIAAIIGNKSERLLFLMFIAIEPNEDRKLKTASTINPDIKFITIND